MVTFIRIKEKLGRSQLNEPYNLFLLEFNYKNKVKSLIGAVNINTHETLFPVSDIAKSIWVRHSSKIYPPVKQVIKESGASKASYITIYPSNIAGRAKQFLGVQYLVCSVSLCTNQPGLITALENAAKAMLEESIETVEHTSPVVTPSETAEEPAPLERIDVILDSIREPLKQSIEAAGIMPVAVDTSKVKELEAQIEKLKEENNRLTELFDKTVTQMNVQCLGLYLCKNKARGIQNLSNTYRYLIDNEYIVMDYGRGYIPTAKAFGLGYCKMSDSTKPQVVITPKGIRNIANDLLKGVA